jgi:hypothetical protein
MPREILDKPFIAIGPHYGSRFQSVLRNLMGEVPPTAVGDLVYGLA